MYLGQDSCTFSLAGARLRIEGWQSRAINQKICWPAGDRVARPVACRGHCRRRGRLNPFKGVVMVKRARGQKGEGQGQGYRFLRLDERKRATRVHRRGVSRVSVTSLSISPLLSCRFFSFSLSFLSLTAASPPFFRLSNSEIDGRLAFTKFYG